MKNISRTIPLYLLSTILLLTSCQQGQDFSDYVEREYCHTNINSIAQAKYPIIGQIKSVQPYDLVDGQYTKEGITPVYPFDTNYIYALYANKQLHTGKDIMDIEDIIGPYTFHTHRLFDRHYYYLDDNQNPINNLRVLNESYGKDWITVDEDLFNIIKIAKEVTKVSDGKFNLFIGELSDYWDKYIQGNANVDFIEDTVDPAQSEEGIQEIQKLTENTPSYKDIDEILLLDEENHRIKLNTYKTAEKVSISLGGIGKGYLTENLYQRFKAANKIDGACYAGSSSIVLMNKNLYQDSWKIQLSSPYGIYYSPIGYLKLNEKISISTSGAQINAYYTKVGDDIVLRHHIIDANTGYPNQYMNQVTLISKTLSSTIMDALSTVFINCSEDEIEIYLNKFREFYHADLEGVFYKKAPVTSESRYVDVYVSKGIKEQNIFEEYAQDGTSTYIPSNYTYLGY